LFDLALELIPTAFPFHLHAAVHDCLLSLPCSMDLPGPRCRETRRRGPDTGPLRFQVWFELVVPQKIRRRIRMRRMSPPMLMYTSALLSSRGDEGGIDFGVVRLAESTPEVPADKGGSHQNSAGHDRHRGHFVDVD